MILSANKNRTTANGRPYAVIELGDVLFFGGSIQKYLTVDKVRGERLFSGDIDVLELYKSTKVLPIIFEK